jgi:hypothetical protein
MLHGVLELIVDLGTLITFAVPWQFIHFDDVLIIGC